MARPGYDRRLAGAHHRCREDKEAQARSDLLKPNSRHIAAARQPAQDSISYTIGPHRPRKGSTMAERVALITGGAKGIGRGIALDLAAQQWSVAICYRTSEAEAAATADAITSRGGRALSIRCNVSDPQAAKGLVAQVEQAVGTDRCADQRRRTVPSPEPVRRNGGRLERDVRRQPASHFLSRPGCRAGHEGPQIRTHHQFQHGQRRSDDFSTGHHGPLHRQGRRLDSDSHAGQTAGAPRHYRQCHLARLHRFRQCAAGRTRRHDKTHPRRIHWDGRRHRGCRTVSAMRRGPVRKWSQYSNQWGMGDIAGSRVASCSNAHTQKYARSMRAVKDNSGGSLLAHGERIERGVSCAQLSQGRPAFLK